MQQLTTVLSENIDGEYVEVRLVPLSQIEKLDGILWSKNSKKHDIDKILESINRYGFQDPAKWDKNLNGGRGGIAFGNGRTEALITGLIAARSEGREPPRGIPIDKTTGEWCIPIKFGVDCESEVEAMALAINHNNLQMSGFEAADISKLWETSGYLAVLSEIAEAGVVPVTVDEEAIADMLLAIGESDEEPELGEDDVDAVLDAAEADDYEIRVKLGEIWKLGRHTIAAGDCTELSNVEQLLRVAGKSDLDGCWTDPPYGVSYEGKTKDKMVIANDSLSKDDLLPFLLDVFANVKYACKEGAPVYVAHPAGELHNVFYQAIVKSDLVLKQTLVWVKNTFAMGRSDYHYQHEPIYYAYTPGAKPSRMGGGDWFGEHNAVSTFFHDKPTANRLHPTMKPVELVVEMLHNSIPPNGSVFEPFLGSGTTLIASEKEGMCCLGFELSEKYCTVVIDRWEQLTGQTAKLIGQL